MSTFSVAVAPAATLADYDFAAATPSHVGCAAGLGSAPLASGSLAGVSGSFTHTDSGCDTGGAGGAFVTSGLGPNGNFPYAMVLVPVRFSLYSLAIAGSSTQDPGTPYSIEISKRDETAPGTVSAADPWTLVTDGFTPGATFDTNFSFGPVVLEPGRYYVRVRPATIPSPAAAKLSFSKFRLGGDELGAADPTPVGGGVEDTLELQLGTAPVSFGNFLLGTDATYTATETARVLSTGSTSTLTVTDPSATATGHLVNGSYTLDDPMRAEATGFQPGNGVSYGSLPLNSVAGQEVTLMTYDGPANDAVTIVMKQHISALQKMRTGTYSKTLTFTLSTYFP